MRHPGIYARYTTYLQQPTSIDDQVRKSRTLAAQEEQTVENAWVFADEAVSGGGEHSHKRIAFQRMLDAWDDGQLDIVYADEVSRLSRDLMDGAMLMRRIESTGVHVVTGDGVDSRREGWQMLWALRLAISGEEIRSISKRTQRSMQGLLEQGFMIAAPPYGYRLGNQRVDEHGKRPKGAQWVIDDAGAEVVRRIFASRKSGLSSASIARGLNDKGVACPRTNGTKRPGYWRPATIHRMLGNRIYKGQFVYQGSAFTRAKLAKRREVPKLTVYERPQFRLVDDALWDACNGTLKSQRLRGGTKHLFASMVDCGDCGCKLSVGGSASSRTLHCPQCEQAVRVGERDAFIGYTSVGAARQALEHALRALFTGPVREEFAARLRARLTAAPSEEDGRLKAKRSELEVSCDRLLQLAKRPGIGIDFIADQLEAAKGELEEVKSKLKALAKATTKLTTAEVERQLAIDPLVLLPRLLDGVGPNHEVRATLKRLIEVFRFVERPAKFQALFEIRFLPGALVAELSQGDVLDGTSVTFQVHTKTGARRPTAWEVAVTQVT